mgnify:CR=1 FL=1
MTTVLLNLIHPGAGLPMSRMTVRPQSSQLVPVAVPRFVAGTGRGASVFLGLAQATSGTAAKAVVAKTTVWAKNSRLNITSSSMG